ncbi:peptide ABC transporter permease [Methanocella sp. CWC-04]|uniref:Peptide ABC transporter permease n=1 Tax=Methanooceanicella nereidis TaxID=2052831 RepID=A0AAP2RAE9_9EURY|nr:ABC transporter permease [Methanocella sp. CWC-04]MCD1293854.1 peptide ABC transporter permease [Methanocella sp. CWC-04]
MKLRDYIFRRFLLLIPVLIGITFITFTLSHMVGDPAAAWVSDKTTPQRYAIIIEQHHLNDPLPIQYMYYINDLVHLDLGNSASQGERPVINCLINYFPATLELTMVAMTMCLFIGIPLGIISAIKKDKLPDHVVRLFSLCGVSVPIFWFGLILQYIFYLQLDMLPLGGRLPLFTTPPPNVTGLYLIDSLLAGNVDLFFESLKHLVMPAFCLCFTYLAVISRMMRSSMLETMTQDFIRTARAKGLSEKAVIFKHALRNALTPTTTVAGLAFGGLLSGAVLTETIFMWPGIGKYSVSAITSSDFASIMGFTLLVVLIYVFTNLVVDVLYAYLDPRVKYG